jgi:hypothetical protein
MENVSEAEVGRGEGFRPPHESELIANGHSYFPVFIPDSIEAVFGRGQ